MQDTITIPIVADLEKLTPAQLSDIISKCRVAAKIGKTVEAFAEAEIAAGKTIPGWEMRSTRTNREWKSEAEAISALARQGVNDPYERKLLTVAAAEKKVPHPDLLASAWEATPTKPTLQPATLSI